MTITVVLADDQALLRGTFRILIDSCTDLRVVGEAADGAEAIAMVRNTRPDIVVMDVRMPGTDGLTATETICSEPDLTHTRVLVLTTFENDDHVARALRAGASGFLGKYVTTDTLLDAIRTVARGEKLLSPGATESLINQFVTRRDPAHPTAEFGKLTARELEITRLVAHGHSNDDIAEALHLSVLTVRTHVQRSMTKVGARDRAQLVSFTYRNGLVR